jgi:hypothetical protein
MEEDVAMTKKLFVGSIGAQMEFPDRTQVQSYPMLTINAKSSQEAWGIGMELSTKRFPPEDGWQHHWANLMEVPQPLIDLIRSPEWIEE